MSDDPTPGLSRAELMTIEDELIPDYYVCTKHHIRHYGEFLPFPGGRVVMPCGYPGRLVSDPRRALLAMAKRTEATDAENARLRAALREIEAAPPSAIINRSVNPGDLTKLAAAAIDNADALDRMRDIARRALGKEAG